MWFSWFSVHLCILLLLLWNTLINVLIWHWVGRGLQRCFLQMLLLAGPGVLISTFFLGAVLHVGIHFDTFSIYKPCFQGVLHYLQELEVWCSMISFTKDRLLWNFGTMCDHLSQTFKVFCLGLGAEFISIWMELEHSVSAGRPTKCYRSCGSSCLVEGPRC